MDKDGGPAFPVTPTGEMVGGVAGGMSLRDYFAAAAIPVAADLLKITPGEYLDGTSPREYLAFTAFTIADAMLKARESTSQEG